MTPEALIILDFSHDKRGAIDITPAQICAAIKLSLILRCAIIRRDIELRRFIISHQFICVARPTPAGVLFSPRHIRGYDSHTLCRATLRMGVMPHRPPPAMRTSASPFRPARSGPLIDTNAPYRFTFYTASW